MTDRHRNHRDQSRKNQGTPRRFSTQDYDQNQFNLSHGDNHNQDFENSDGWRNQSHRFSESQGGEYGTNANSRQDNTMQQSNGSRSFDAFDSHEQDWNSDRRPYNNGTSRRRLSAGSERPYESRLDSDIQRNTTGNSWHPYEGRFEQTGGSTSYSSLYGQRQDQGRERDQEMQKGTFSGRGPKGYARSDDRICEEANECLSDHAEIDASDIEVKVKGGHVTLTGMVHDRRTKRLAEDAIDKVRGVKDVSNQIRVQSSQETNATSPQTIKSHTGTGQKGDALNS